MWWTRVPATMARGSVSMCSWMHCTSRSLPPMQCTRQVLFECECFFFFQSFHKNWQTGHLTISGYPPWRHHSRVQQGAPCLGLPCFKARSGRQLGLFSFTSGHFTELPTSYLPIYLHTYLPVYLPIYLHTYVPTYLPSHIPTYPPTYLPTYLHTYLPIYLPI